MTGKKYKKPELRIIEVFSNLENGENCSKIKTAAHAHSQQNICIIKTEQPVFAKGIIRR